MKNRKVKFLKKISSAIMLTLAFSELGLAAGGKSLADTRMEMIKEKYLTAGVVKPLPQVQQKNSNEQLFQALKSSFDQKFSLVPDGLAANAAAGSSSARAKLELMKMQTLQGISSQDPVLEAILQPLGLEAVANDLYQNLKVKIGNQLLAYSEKAREAQARGQKEVDKYRSETGILDRYEAQDKKLNDLILANDRIGVAKILEAYLPWALMEPSEVSAWKVWLDAIAHPDTAHTTVALRGVNFATDKIQTLKIPGEGIRIGMFSTVLTKNQGSYTRRLRSLSTNRLKNGEGRELFQGFPAPLMTRQFLNHSTRPEASSFLSFTFNPHIALAFTGPEMKVKVKGLEVFDKEGELVKKATGALVAVRMDSRRLFPNPVSPFAGEMELLAPLIVFPDEVLLYQEGRGEESEKLDEFMNRLELIVPGIKERFAVDDNDATLNTKLAVEFGSAGIKFLQSITSFQNLKCSEALLN